MRTIGTVRIESDEDGTLHFYENEDWISFYKENIQALIKVIARKEDSDFLINLGNWLKINDCKHDFKNAVFERCKHCRTPKLRAEELNKLFGEER